MFDVSNKYMHVLNNNPHLSELTKEELQIIKSFVRKKRSVSRGMLRALTFVLNKCNLHSRSGLRAIAIQLLSVLFVSIYSNSTSLHRNSHKVRKLCRFVRTLRKTVRNLVISRIGYKTKYGLEDYVCGSVRGISKIKHNFYEHCLMHLNSLAYLGNKKYKFKLRIKQREQQKDGINIDDVYYRLHNSSVFSMNRARMHRL